MRELSGRSLTQSYSMALVIVALMSIASHVMLERVMKESEGAAAVINISGRQRMLSQRIASSAAQMSLGIAGAREQLSSALDMFERSHHDLVAGDTAVIGPLARSPNLHAIYFEGPHPLDAAVKSFIAQGRHLATLPIDEPARPAELSQLLEEAKGPLLDDLSQVVLNHQQRSDQRLGLLERMQTISLGIVLATLLIEALLIFRPMVLRIAQYMRTLATLATTDALTQALNRRSFHDRANAELSRARRQGTTATLLMIDADRFKAVNDTYGHAAGDAVLQALSATVASHLRPTDLFGRLGGEEFGVFLPDTALPGAIVVADRLREAIAGLRVPAGAATISFTVSIGAAEIDPGHGALQAAMDRADHALYEAKASGRNRVVGSPLVDGGDAWAAIATAA